MGLLGWHELRDGVELRGVVRGGDHAPSLYADGDWCLHVEPGPAHVHLLSNRRGERNPNDLIECEIRPGGTGTEHEALFLAHFPSLADDAVVITGTWVEDLSHEPAPGPHKTEIHPITSVLRQLPDPDRHTRRLTWYVFSDGWSYEPVYAPLPVPHHGENRRATMMISMPVGSTYKLIYEDRRAKSVEFRTETRGSRLTLVGVVESGTPADDQGFYAATLELNVGDPPEYRFSTGRPAVLSHGLQGKKTILATITDGRLTQIWDPDRWRLDFPAELAGHSGLRFSGQPAVFGLDAATNKKALYAVTTDGRLAQLWDRPTWQLDFPAELAGHSARSRARASRSLSAATRRAPRRPRSASAAGCSPAAGLASARPTSVACASVPRPRSGGRSGGCDAPTPAGEPGSR
jgi:hypothetical protein